MNLIKLLSTLNFQMENDSKHCKWGIEFLRWTSFTSLYFWNTGLSHFSITYFHNKNLTEFMLGMELKSQIKISSCNQNLFLT